MRSEILRPQGAELVSASEGVNKLQQYSVVAMSGVPGAGKSTVAEALSQSTGAKVISTDAIRARDFGQAKHVDASQLAQLRVAQASAYKTMLDDTQETLRRGQKVIMDATFLNPDQQKAVEDVLRDHNGAWAIVTASEEALERRTATNPKLKIALQVTLDNLENDRYKYPSSLDIPIVVIDNS